MILILHAANYVVIKRMVLDSLGDQYTSFLFFGGSSVKQVMESAVFIAYLIEAGIILGLGFLSFWFLYRFYQSLS